MILLHNIGARVNSNYNTPQEILMCQEPLSFDGIYRNVLENKHILKGKDITLFIGGNTVGGDNSFDAPMPLERFCDWNEIMQLIIELDCKVGWHTWSHRDLTLIPIEEVYKEIKPPFPMDYFAYPYGKWNAEVAEAVRNMGYKKAYSVTQGDGTQFALNRKYLNW